MAVRTATGRADYFQSNSCTGTSGSACMVMGAYHPVSTWNGLSATYNLGNSSSWAIWPVPIPATKRNIFANEVSCASMADCVFVGDHYNKTSMAQLAEAWNGTNWRIIDSTGPTRTTFSSLNDVSCPSNSFCLLVGVAGGRHSHATAYTWTNQTTLKQVRVPGPAHARGTELAGLSCANASTCMAVGNYRNAAGTWLPYAVRWHTGSWRVLSVPSIKGLHKAFMQGDSCVSATQCVAVGGVGAKVSHAFADLWSHGKWRVSAVRKSESGFFGVSCPVVSRCFAAGWTGGNPLIEKWNGRSWVTQRVSNTSINPWATFQHVSCVSATNCEAVGYTYGSRAPTGDLTLAELWDGHHWTEQTTPNP